MSSISRRLRVAAVVTVSLLLPAQAQAGCSWWNWWRCYTETRYPIVLSHGLLGFDELGSFLEYFYGIPEALEDGGAEVYVTLVSQVNSSTERGEELIAQLETLRAVTGHPKFNLIGHSQGGLDVRYVASVRPDLVASVSTVASPHKGVPGVENFQDTDWLLGLAADLLEAVGWLIGLLAGSDSPLDGDAALEQFLPAGVAAFNAAHPQGVPSSSCGEGQKVVNGIRYYSWSGIGQLTNAFDVTDPFLALTDLVLGGITDGLVERCSSHLGDVIRDNYFQNHLDQVNQLFGLVSIFEQSPESIFRAHANRLKKKGL
ncbi:MAG: triacylglycerol lipase [Myxococcota bacterium]|nr:triacylglycerol lipase [Myxococcota bacterium]